MNLMSDTSIIKINLLNTRTLWFIKTFSFLLRFHFPKRASSASSFGSWKETSYFITQCFPKKFCFIALTKKCNVSWDSLSGGIPGRLRYLSLQIKNNIQYLILKYSDRRTDRYIMGDHIHFLPVYIIITKFVCCETFWTSLWTASSGDGKGKEKETNRNGQGFRFPNICDLCRVQINYSGRKNNHTKTRVILHKLHSYEVDLTIFHKFRKSANWSNS